MRKNTLRNYSFVKPKSRFNLLLLEPGEQYLNDCACVYFDTNRQQEVMGTLKICSFSVFFASDEQSFPIRRIQYDNIYELVKTPNNEIIIKSSKHTDMKEQNGIKPYNSVEVDKTHQLTPKFVNFEEIFQLLNRMHKLFKSGDKEDVYVYANEYINSRLDSLQPHIGMFKRVDETILENCPATQILPLMEISGRFVLTQYAFYFIPYVEENIATKSANLNDVVYLFRRRYVMQHTGLEFFFQKTSTFIVFSSPEVRNKVQATIYNSTKCKVKPDDGSQFNEMIKKWKERSLSNYEYLIYLNFQAGRSYNDLTQYPVFPWVLSNYTSDSLDLNDTTNFRDLSKPIGALNHERLDKLRDRMMEMNPPLFLYGTHYSTPAYVVFFLVRLVPEFMLHLQNGVFDKPDRIFSSIEECWNGVLSHTSDVKELVPEFYQNTSFLNNKDHVYFGYRTTQDMIDSVRLPKWATTQEDFEQIMKDALESDYVSENINKWVDLIFGYLQRPPAAFDADNVFYPATYENDFIDTKTISFKDQAREFGQTPSQLFEIPSPERNSLVQVNYPVPPLQAVDVRDSFTFTPLSRIDFTCSVTPKTRHVIEIKGLDKPLILEAVNIDLDEPKEISGTPIKEQQPQQRLEQRTNSSGFFSFSGFFGKKK
ncbi:protein FAN, putative [Entamoeba invadens IP1]|uniref:Protein FAN, putative n=1 Tax=Entamoeba invadens IP1 TaxID=370355 RepID=A0A0A1U6M4_ENTIV|nr:protein FAN, putative [Entamoeba invadens IP1]ELP90068.1 protein FAN, putative [Entamoeba invadens IP1]|eukprot:XP_004256839.1 protein FAN, putative [Entamoeba invadens IP1]